MHFVASRKRKLRHDACVSLRVCVKDFTYLCETNAVRLFEIQHVYLAKLHWYAINFYEMFTSPVQVLVKQHPFQRDGQCPIQQTI